MGLFQTKKIQSLIIFIIALVAILWIFQDNYLNISVFNKSTNKIETTEDQNQERAYLEKIDNFFIKEYSSNQVLLHTIEADVYKNFKNSPAELETVKVITFDEFQKETAIINSNRAVIFESSTIHFIGAVEIKTLSGISHELDTELLIVKDGQINSNQKIVYLGESAKINAQGMEMNIDKDTLDLNGVVEILQDNGATIDTTNLFISHADGSKKYMSEDATVYRSNQHIVNADRGIDIDLSTKLTRLLGNVEVLNDSGSSLKSYNLIIDQSNGGELFMSNSPSRFQSNTVDIEANKMHYDAISKKLILKDGVVATYE